MTAEPNSQTTLSNPGTVVSVRGSVVDVRFNAQLPPIYSVLRAGAEQQIVIEVLAQRDARHVRGIALTPTQGLARGMAVQDTGGPLQAPVGKGVLSRMFDVFGNAIDREPKLSDVQWRSVHRAPPPLVRRCTTSEIFETGIKVIDVLVPLEKGGKAGLFCGAGVGKTVCSPCRIPFRRSRRSLDRFSLSTGGITAGTKSPNFTCSTIVPRLDRFMRPSISDCCRWMEHGGANSPNSPGRRRTFPKSSAAARPCGRSSANIFSSRSFGRALNPSPAAASQFSKTPG